MSIKHEWIQFGAKGECKGFLAHLEGQGSGPALLVIQEAWGPDAHIQDVALRYAAAGYLVLAPDLFYMDGARPEVLSEQRVATAKAFLDKGAMALWFDPAKKAEAIAALPEAERTKIPETLDTLFGGLQSNRDKYMRTVKEAAAYLRSHGASSLGSVGYCLGGGLSVLLACQDPDLKAAVIYYGGNPPKEEIPNIKCEVLGFYGSTDKRLIDALPEFEAEMKARGKNLETHVYPGVGHAFFNDTRPSFNAQASRDSFARCLEFFNRSLA